MKLIIGFIAGLVVGGFWVSNSTEQQRRKAQETAARASRLVKDSRIGKAVDDNVSKVASATGDRVVDAVDNTGDALADTLGTTSEQHATT
jgi:FtsZ-interacting cell division protein ZipA